MSVNEMRKDYLLNRWVIVAAGRKKRPRDFVEKTREQRKGACPFCPGNERMTPPAVLLYLPTPEGIARGKDSDGNRPKDWLVRCVPNMYPALAPPSSKKQRWKGEAEFVCAEALGHHEVVVESPNHDEHPGVARISQLIHVINACLDRMKGLSKEPYVKYVSVFRNHKREAGASISHTHTQLIALPMIPKTIQEELEASKKFWRETERCCFCDVLDKESNGPRFVWRSENFIAFAPWASVHPFEFWIFPIDHQPSLLEMTKNEVEDLAKTLRACLGGLGSLLSDPPYNMGLHTAPVGDDFEWYHWHIEVYPRVTAWGGFEKSAGMFINEVSPERAAINLREAIQKELRL